jgi:hypothetical protein
MGKNTKTKTLEETPAIDYENVKVNTEGVSISVAMANMVIIETPSLADSVPNRLGA